MEESRCEKTAKDKQRLVVVVHLQGSLLIYGFQIFLRLQLHDSLYHNMTLLLYSPGHDSSQLYVQSIVQVKFTS